MQHTHAHKVLHNVAGAIITFAILFLIRYIVVRNSKNETVKKIAGG